MLFGNLVAAEGAYRGEAEVKRRAGASAPLP